MEFARFTDTAQMDNSIVTLSNPVNAGPVFEATSRALSPDELDAQMESDAANEALYLAAGSENRATAVVLFGYAQWRKAEEWLRSRGTFAGGAQP